MKYGKHMIKIINKNDTLLKSIVREIFLLIIFYAKY